VSLLAINTKSLLKAHDESLKIYQKEKDFHQSIKVLRVANISSVIVNQPKDMTKKSYINLLNNYGYFLSLTDTSNLYVLKNYCEAKKVLEKVNSIDINRTVTYLNLGDLYWKIFLAQSYIYNHNSGFIKQYHGSECLNKEGRPTFAYLAKQMYLEYEKHMLINKKEKLIPKRIKPLLNNNKIYVLVNDSLKNKRTESFNPCIDFVNTLNKLPESKRTYCNKNISNEGNLFKKLPWDSLSLDDQKKYSSKWYATKVVPLEYKGIKFLDYRYGLTEQSEFGKYYVNSCTYKLLDLEEKFNTHIIKNTCQKIETN